MVNSKFLLPSLNRERYRVLWYTLRLHGWGGAREMRVELPQEVYAQEVWKFGWSVCAIQWRNRSPILLAIMRCTNHVHQHETLNTAYSMQSRAQNQDCWLSIAIDITSTLHIMYSYKLLTLSSWCSLCHPSCKLWSRNLIFHDSVL